MYHILRLLLYRLWIVSTLTLCSCFVIFWLYGFFLAVTAFTLGISGILYTAQDLLLFYPNDPPDSRAFVLQPSNYKLPYESVKIKTRDGYKIHMFFIRQLTNSNHKPTMIFFHGNAGNMGQRLSNVSGFYHKLGINILLVEYRGYGLSEGTPSEQGLYIDAQTAFDYIMQRDDIDRTKIIIFGRSLGGAVAIDLASRIEYKNKVWALIVENTFTSIPDMARIILKWKCLKWLPMFCHKNKFMSLHKISEVVCPTLVVCGAGDALVPPRMARELVARCGAPRKRLAALQRGGHDDTWLCGDYYPALQRFLQRVPPLPPNASLAPHTPLTPHYEVDDEEEAEEEHSSMDLTMVHTV
ncbi:protein ABHD13 [Danaus plexippus]|uniref:Bem46 protein n=1 Tax=Danaus plexippus plexippus TaxID=278856 RepID=A0A212EKJ2_DANPL|nr:protein ABHD13 [Danaus plexippus]OWR42000.1 Bem46 protein [Danaus plexippus plexippus]